MGWSVVLTDEQFWLGVVALGGVGATVLSVWTQRRLAADDRDQERRRVRRDELVETYGSVGTHAAKVVIAVRSELHGDVPDMSELQAELYREGRATKYRLMLHGASQDVIDKWNTFQDELGALDGAGKGADTQPLDLALLDLYQAFNRHVEIVWASPENPRRLVAPASEEVSGASPNRTQDDEPEAT